MHSRKEEAVKRKRSREEETAGNGVNDEDNQESYEVKSSVLMVVAWIDEKISTITNTMARSYRVAEKASTLTMTIVIKLRRQVTKE